MPLLPVEVGESTEEVRPDMLLLLLLPFLRLCEEDESGDDDMVIREWVDDGGEEVDAIP